MAEIELRHVTRRFTMTALEDVSLTVPDGGFVVLLGPTGAGKTTLLPMVSGLDRPDAGQVLIGGASPGDRTMVDALLPAIERLSQGLPAAAGAARDGADRTAQMTRAKAGRSAYINADQLKGHVDPGAEAVARLFEHLARG